MGVALAFAFPLEGTARVRLEWESKKNCYDNRLKKCLKLTNGRYQRWMNGRWFRETWHFLLVPVIKNLTS
jgi:hypothetical protein